MKQRGFTLIELVVVIVILGILAATALPKFIDLSSEADAAALQGVAGGMNSAMTINYAGCAAKGHSPTTGKCETVSTCEGVASLLQGGMPVGYSVTAATIGTTNGTTNTDCSVFKVADTSLSATFTGVAAGN